jgi:hypothetical protein
LVLHLDATNPKSYAFNGARVWKDLNKNAYDFTLTGTNSIPVYDSNGISFNGINHYAYVPNSTSLTLTTSFSMSAWIKCTAFSRYHTIAGRWGSPNKNYKLGVLPTGEFYIDISSTGADDNYKMTNIQLVADVWYNVTGVYTSGATPSLDVYVNGDISNGTLIGTIPSIMYSNNNVQFNVGYDNASNYFYGNISNIQLYNRVISATEILQNYNATKAKFGL